MWTWLAKFQPNAGFGKKIFMAVVLTGIGAAAFFLGRLAGPQSVEAQDTSPNAFNPLAPTAPTNQGDSEYSRRIVATIYGNIAISREELGEFLITRLGAERLEYLVNRKIVEKVCAPYNITVTDAEIHGQLVKDLRAYGGIAMTEKVFADQILRKFNKSMYEWKEDVIRPKLMLAKLLQPKVAVTDRDVEKAYEARFGPKVRCRLIVLREDEKHKDQIWKDASTSEAKFKENATKQSIMELAAQAGLAPPIHKHFGDPWIEQRAFGMKPGDVSELKQLQDKTWLIMRCEEHIPADKSRSLVDMRAELSRELEEVKLAQMVGDTFKDLRQQAAPRLLLTAQQRQTDLDQRLHKDLNPAAVNTGPPSTATSRTPN